MRLNREFKIIFITLSVITLIIVFAFEKYANTIDRLLEEKNNTKVYVYEKTEISETEETEKDILILGLEKPRVDPLTRVIVEAKTTEDERTLLMRTLHAEARGVDNKEERAAVVWAVLNRVDSREHPNSIKEVVEEEFAFCISESTPEVWEEIKENSLDAVVYDTLFVWLNEKKYYDERRVLGKEFCHFYGDGERNYFYKIGKTGLEFWPVVPNEEVQAECLSILLGER